MNKVSEFVVIDHNALKAGKHQDLRFKLPNSPMWASFAVKKRVPLTTGVKVLAIRTNDHSYADATFTGVLKSGYGAGTFKKFDGGSCEILKFDKKHIAINFHGHKVKGLYHLISVQHISSKNKSKQKEYILFKGK